jgi:peptidoglycan/LPS O-acetylase OafA/YrhL
MDGLRGLAALTVFVQHARSFLPHANNPLLRWISDGSAAVDLFFVLSGFVLALPFVGSRRKPLNYIDFAVRRCFRIYPAYWLALLLALIMQRFYFPALSGINTMMTPFLHQRIGLADVLKYATLVGPGINGDKLLPVVWSLILEMRMSLIFPVFISLFLFLRLHSGPPAQAAVWVILTVTGLVVPIIAYIPFFFLGIIVAANFDYLRESARRLSGAVRLAGWVLALLLYHGVAQFVTHRIYRDIMASLATAAFIILITSSSSARGVLSSRPFKFLGEVSYSFYLLHFPILLLVFSILFPNRSFWLCWSTSLMITWLVSWIIFRFVEVPMQKTGRWALSYFRGGGFTTVLTDTTVGISPDMAESRALEPTL